MKKNNNNPDWVKNSIFYQIFPDRFYNGDLNNDPLIKLDWHKVPTRDSYFGGDLKGIIKKTSYLKDLGINAIYLNPVFEAGKNHKYDTADYRRVDPLFGKEEDLLELVRNVHGLDIRIILDGVFNHCGDSFWAFRDVLKNGKRSKYFKWFFIQGEKIKKNPINYQTAGGCEYLPKLNLNNPEIRKHILDAVKYWTEKSGIDGWRLDVPWKVGFDFWKEFGKMVREINPEAYLVGEIWRDPVPWVQEDIFDGVMNYKLRGLIVDFCIKDSLDAEDFDYELENLLNILGNKIFMMLNLLSSHDTPRILTIANNDIDRVLLAITILMTFTGAPMIYYGDEIGMKGENDPDCRRTMIWDRRLWNRKIYHTYKRLIELRRKHQSLRTGKFKRLLVFNRFYSYLRSEKSDNIIIIINPGEKQPYIEIPLPKNLYKKTFWVDSLSERDFQAIDGILILKNIDRQSSHVLEPI